MKAAVLVAEMMNADPPRSARVRRGKIRVRHHDLLDAVADDALDAWILVGEDAFGRALGQHLLERVVDTVERGEDEDVRDVVEKPRPRPLIAVIAVANAAREQVEHTVLLDDARVEDRPVARHGSRRNNGCVGQTGGRSRCHQETRATEIGATRV